MSRGRATALTIHLTDEERQTRCTHGRGGNAAGMGGGGRGKEDV